MTTHPAAAQQLVAFCFAKCRSRQTYTRLLASRPVYSCSGCGGTREIVELGPTIKGRIEPIDESTPISTLVQKWTGGNPRGLGPRKPRNKNKETKMPKPKTDSPLMAAIKRAIAEQPVALTEDRVREIFAEELEKQLGGSPSGAPARAARPGPRRAPLDSDGAAAGLTHPKVTSETCPRMPHRGPHGKKCQIALEEADA
jgi:hypothetical protein